MIVIVFLKNICAPYSVLVSLDIDCLNVYLLLRQQFCLLLKLSQERADAVKNTLVELGVDASRITSVGMGSSDPWHIPNAGYDGAAASANRKVVLIDIRSTTAQTILEQLNS